MNHKTGLKETSSAFVIFSLSPAFLVLVGGNSAVLGSGALINCLICFIISLFMLLSVKFYFSVCGNQNIIDSTRRAMGSFMSAVIGIIFAALIFASTAFSLNMYSSDIIALSTGLLRERALIILFCIASGFCAWLGIEALTRQSYLILLFGFVIVALLILSTLPGINTDNFYPVFGTNLKGTFGSFLCLSLYMGVGLLLLFCDCLRTKEDGIKCALRIIITVFAIAIAVFVLYVTTVPYPLGRIFSHSLQAIFASSGSSELFHRFEFFLIALFSLFAVVSSSVGIIATSYSLAKICSISDTRPFVLILTVILYYISNIDFSSSVYLFVCLSLSMLSIFVPLLTSVILYKKPM